MAQYVPRAQVGWKIHIFLIDLIKKDFAVLHAIWKSVDLAKFDETVRGNQRFTWPMSVKPTKKQCMYKKCISIHTYIYLWNCVVCVVYLDSWFLFIYWLGVKFHTCWIHFNRFWLTFLSWLNYLVPKLLIKIDYPGF